MGIKPRYLIGIDLGTTNSVVAYKEIEGESAIQIFPLSQLVKAGLVEERNTLPSFLYLPNESELSKGSLKLPWDEKLDYAVGEFARNRGSEVPSRLVSSAKSWLSHQGINRQEALLPFKAPEGVPQISPIEASSRYLLHLKQSWNHQLGKTPETAFENQILYLTVPASFDAVARDLTVKAAKNAGLKVTLLEEPQAAFYAWIYKHEATWRKMLEVQDQILIVDVGGGTTDFSLVSVVDEKGNLELQRVAVGNHILLGGDNMDITLAHHVSQKLKNKLDAWQSMALWHSCRVAKEGILSSKSAEKMPISILGRGSSVIGGALKTELTREEVHQILLEGFFPIVQSKDHQFRTVKVGLSELNLPYASEPAITRQIARFLYQHKKENTSSMPTAILFNGGVFKATIFQKRVVEVLNAWLQEEKKSKIKILENQDLDLAVAIGAVYYGEAQRGKGIRIRGGAGRSYYIGIESSMPAIPGIPPPMKALCVVPNGMEEGTSADIPDLELGLVIGETVNFPFFSSNRRKNDTLGVVLEDITELDPNVSLETSLEPQKGIKEGEHIPVKLHSKVTEIGTLALSCQSPDGKHQWNLEFNIRETPEKI